MLYATDQSKPREAGWHTHYMHVDSGTKFKATALDLLPDPAPKDIDAMSIVWHLIRITRHAEHRLEYDVHRPLGWTWAGFRIMVNVYVLGPLEPSQLADILEVSRPTISAALLKLERDNYITREPHRVGKNQILVTLTDAGREAVVRAAESHHTVEMDVVKALTNSERAELSRLLGKIYDAQ